MLSEVVTSNVINYNTGDSQFWRWQYLSYCFFGIGHSNKVKFIAKAKLWQSHTVKTLVRKSYCKTVLEFTVQALSLI